MPFETPGVITLVLMGVSSHSTSQDCIIWIKIFQGRSHIFPILFWGFVSLVSKSSYRSQNSRMLLCALGRSADL